MPDDSLTFAFLTNATSESCLTLLTEQLFTSISRQATSDVETANVLFVGIDTYVQATWPTGACWRTKSWVRRSWVCHDCYTRPWLHRAADRIDAMLVHRKISAHQQRHQEKPTCNQFLVVFAPIIAGPEQHAQPLWLRRFFQHEPCVVRLLADAIHGVYRHGVDVSFPSQLKTHVNASYGTMVPLRPSPKAHLLGFQGSAIAPHEADTPVEQRHMLRMRQEVIKVLVQADNSSDLALRLVPKVTNESLTAAGSFMDAMNSTFCLVLRGSSCYTWRLLECLFFGSIPVIVEDEAILPFSELLNWDEFSVRWAWAYVHLLPAYLRSLSSQPGRVQAMQNRGQEVWLRHFRNADCHVRTVMQILERRQGRSGPSSAAGRRLAARAKDHAKGSKAPQTSQSATNRCRVRAVPPGRIAVVTWSDRMHEFAPVEEVICGYCKRHGYDRITSATWRNASLLSGWTWQKIPFVLEVLRHYEAVLHLDDDAVINQLEQDVAGLLNAFPGRDVILSAVERNGRGFQGSPKTGVFVVRNTPFVHALLERLLTTPECAEYRNMSACCREQDCLWRLMTNRVGVMRRFRRESGRFGFLRAADWDCRDDHSYLSTIQLGRCNAPFAFHGMGTQGWLKGAYIRHKAVGLLPVASRTDWQEGRVNLTNRTYSSGRQLPEVL